MLRKQVRMTLLPGLLMALLIGVALVGCGTQATNSINTSKSSGAGSASAAQTHCDSSTAPICTRSIKVNGKSELVLVSPSGRTLYYFMPDSATTIACTGACATTWPPLLAPTAIGAAGSTAHLTGITGTLSTVHRSEETQIVYNDHPLYTYSKDAAPGDAKGDGIGGKWSVATPVLAPASGSNNSGY